MFRSWEMDAPFVVGHEDTRRPFSMTWISNSTSIHRLTRETRVAWGTSNVSTKPILKTFA